MSSVLSVIKKFFISAFVVVTFAAYVLHERVTNADAAKVALAPLVMLAPPAEPTTTTAATVAQASPNTLAQATSTATAATLAPAPEFQALPTTTTQPATVAAPALALPAAVSTATPTEMPTVAPTVELTGRYKNGTYTGAQTNAVYGWVQVRAVVENGQITGIEFLDYPQERRTSVRINSRAVPALQTEAIQAQSARVDIVSGATLTSRAFIQSLQSALDLAAGRS